MTSSIGCSVASRLLFSAPIHIVETYHASEGVAGDVDPKSFGNASMVIEEQLGFFPRTLNDLMNFEKGNHL